MRLWVLGDDLGVVVYRWWFILLHDRLLFGGSHRGRQLRLRPIMSLNLKSLGLHPIISFCEARFGGAQKVIIRIRTDQLSVWLTILPNFGRRQSWIKSNLCGLLSMDNNVSIFFYNMMNNSIFFWVRDRIISFFGYRTLLMSLIKRHSFILKALRGVHLISVLWWFESWVVEILRFCG